MQPAQGAAGGARTVRGAYPTTQRVGRGADHGRPRQCARALPPRHRAARQLWDTQLAAARAAGLRAPPEGFGSEMDTEIMETTRAAEYRSLQWSIKLLSGRLRAKAAAAARPPRHGRAARVHRLRDGLPAARPRLPPHNRAANAWVDNRLGSDDDDDDESEENEDEDDENSNTIISDGDDAAGRGPAAQQQEEEEEEKKQNGGYRDVLVLLDSMATSASCSCTRKSCTSSARTATRRTPSADARAGQDNKAARSRRRAADREPRCAAATIEGWREGRRNGYFTVTADSGALEYRGEFRNDKRNGQGVAIYDDGESYEGEWRDNKRHGEGTYRYRDGAVYVGGYVDDKKQGRGKATFASGNIYEGVSFSFMFT